MKGKIKNNEPITLEILEKVLDEKLEQKLEEKLEQKLNEKLEQKLANYPTTAKVELMIERSEMRTDDRARQYRDEILTKMDQVIGELAQMREDREFEKHDHGKQQLQLDEHEKRINKLEKHNN